MKLLSEPVIFVLFHICLAIFDSIVGYDNELANVLGTGVLERRRKAKNISMSKPILLVFLLVILIVTSQFEWRQPLVEPDAAATSSSSQKQKRISDREEAVKEKVLFPNSLVLTSLSSLSTFIFW